MPKSISNKYIAAVLIPIYTINLSEKDLYSINLTVKTLNKWDIYLLIPNEFKKNEKYLKNTFSKSLNFFSIPSRYLKSRYTYSKLLLSKTFYSFFKSYRYILVVQPDALVFSDSLSEWCNQNYSYIGAPFFEGLKEPVKPLRFIGAGNGGFSLRKVNHFLRVLENFSYTPLPHTFPLEGLQSILYRTLLAFNRWPLLPLISEDLYWGLVVPQRFQFFSIPQPEIALRFSFEAEPEYLFNLAQKKLPFGCHAWTKYNESFWNNTLQEYDIILPSN